MKGNRLLAVVDGVSRLWVSVDDQHAFGTAQASCRIVQLAQESGGASDLLETLVSTWMDVTFDVAERLAAGTVDTHEARSTGEVDAFKIGE